MKTITKKVFTSLLKEIIQQDKDLDEFENVIGKLSPNSYPPIFEFTSLSLKVLEYAMDDTKWLSYWYWELNQGKNWRKGCVKDKDGKDIPIKTISQLYDFIVNKEY